MLGVSGTEAVDAYIESFPRPVQMALGRMRRAVLHAVPDADQVIAYDIPTFKLAGRNIVHIAAWTEHVGLYPAPSGIDAFAERTAPYRSGKGTLRFSLTEPLPLDLVTDITAFRVSEELGRLPATKRPIRNVPGKPAQQALDAAGIATLGQLAKLAERDVAALHGMGPKAVSYLREELHCNGLGFKPPR
jgi:uncharacterized protein YdhG (YjbR/CyaY superfamily)